MSKWFKKTVCSNTPTVCVKQYLITALYLSGHVWCTSAWFFLPRNQCRLGVMLLATVGEVTGWRLHYNECQRWPQSPIFTHAHIHANSHMHIFHPALLLQSNLCWNYYNPPLGIVVLLSVATLKLSSASYCRSVTVGKWLRYIWLFTFNTFYFFQCMKISEFSCLSYNAEGD